MKRAGNDREGDSSSGDNKRGTLESFFGSSPKRRSIKKKETSASAAAASAPTPTNNNHGGNQCFSPSRGDKRKAAGLGSPTGSRKHRASIGALNSPGRKSLGGMRQQGIAQFASPSSKAQSNAKPKVSRSFLRQDSPDPTDEVGTFDQDGTVHGFSAHQMVMNIQFERDAAMVLRPPTGDELPNQAMQPKYLPMNDEQMRVVKRSADEPLSVRAGAGSGKTHTMVQRAVFLVKEHDVQPEKILMVTFSKKATEELKERIASVFVYSDATIGDVTVPLPTIKNFHSLAFSWICRCWKACGLGERPTVLATKSQQQRLMDRALEANVDRLRLDKCRSMLGRRRNVEAEGGISWLDVENICKQNWNNETFDKIHKMAEAFADEMICQSIKEVESMKVEDQESLLNDRQLIAKAKLRELCYLELLRQKQYPQKELEDIRCPFESRWLPKKAERKQKCNEYLEMVRKARLGGHSKCDYIAEDAQIWEIYDKLQLETGQIDFDTMLTIFTDKVLGNPTIARRFHDMYSHVIVDEYQDNSEVQAKMLNEIVQGGLLTVVGDDDQCIYEFRGASPGNFERLKKDYEGKWLGQRLLSVQEETLIINHRSTGNILKVAAAFLSNDRTYRKELRPERSNGDPVELWKCHDQTQQAKAIALHMAERRKQGVDWGEMACLFRCFKFGQLGSLNSILQRELAAKSIPFVVVGGKTIFERETVLDLLAYTRLAIQGSRDDEAFTRVINKPSRKLPKDKLVLVLKEFARANEAKASGKSSHMYLEDAARAMNKTGIGLSKSRHRGLTEFLALVDNMRNESNRLSLPNLLQYVWVHSGLEKLYNNKAPAPEADGHKRILEARNDSRIENTDSDATSEDHVDLSAITDALVDDSWRDESRSFPPEIKLLLELAEMHVDEWKEREKKVLEQHCKQIPSLVELARKSIKQNNLPLEALPEHIQDDIILAPDALGRPVIRSFLAEIALQQSVEEDESTLNNHEAGKVSISTIHRAKGLEWKDVYVPFFNDELMPTKPREDFHPNGQGERHVQGCNARNGNRCDRDCRAFFAEREDSKKQRSAAERHEDEERRLAHVAATRAKDRLVFIEIDEYNRKDMRVQLQETPFLKNLEQFPSSIFKKVDK